MQDSDEEWVVLQRGDDGPLPIGLFRSAELAGSYAAAASAVDGLEYEVEPLGVPDPGILASILTLILPA